MVNTILPAQTGSLSTHTFTMNFDAQKFFGWDPKSNYGSKTLWAASPAAAACLLVWAQPADLSSTATYYASVEIDMDVLVSDLTTPTSS